MMYSIVKGDLLCASTEYIVQQNCCTALKPFGLSEAISKKWPEVNPYKERKQYKGNWSVKEDRPNPGSIYVYTFEEPLLTGLKGVICAFAQYTHGKPGKYKDPLGLDTDDSFIDRIEYFKECLEAIATLQPKSVGFPFKIGCGLAGGSWTVYEKIIQDWCKRYSIHVQRSLESPQQASYHAYERQVNVYCLQDPQQHI